MNRNIYSLVRECLLLSLAVIPTLLFAQVETEPNNSLNSANEVTVGVPIAGTVGCSTVDRDDYFGTNLPGDGTVRLIVTYTNTSGDAGADASAYVYDGNGRLLASKSRNNVPVAGATVDTLLVYSRAADRVNFRVYSTYCFGYTLQYELIDPPTDEDAEPNDELVEGAPLAHGAESSGRIGYRGTDNLDQNDYWEAVLPDDGTVNLSLTFYNASNDSGADVYAYIYDKAGRLLASETIANVAAGGQASAAVTAYCRAKDAVYFRVYSLYSFGYEISYTVTPPPTAADAEPNNDQSTAAAYVLSSVTEGRVGYRKASGQDQNDYFKTTLSDDGNIRLIVTYLNTSNDPGADAYAYIYDGSGRLLRSQTRANVAVNGEVTDTLYAPGRALDQVYFRIYSLYCFGYRIQADIIEPETSGDEEPNNDFATAAPVAHDTETEGRVGFTTANQRDADDYFRAVLPDDGTVTLTVDFINESSDSGADGYAYIYDSAGRLLNSVTAANVGAGGNREVEISAYGRSQDTMYLRVYSLYSFSYRLRYQLTPPPVGPDPESNDALETATFIAHDTDAEGRVGYRSGNGHDQNDYYYAVLPDDGSVELSVTYENTSNDGAADAYMYIYDDAGRLLVNSTTPNVPAGTQASSSITAFGRAQDTVFFRVNSLYSFGYTLGYEVTPPATGADEEPNDQLSLAVPIPYDEVVDGRVGFRTGNGHDQNDYYQAILPDDGAVRLIVTYYNESNDSGADSYAYIYDHRGALITSSTNPNQSVGTTRKDTLFAYGRARDTVHFRIYSLYAFGYTAEYEVLPPAFPADEEPNDQLAEAPTIGMRSGVRGRVGFKGHTQDQNDYFRLSNPELASFSIELEGENASNDGGADLYLYLYNERGGLVRSFTLANLAPGRFSRSLVVECIDPSELYLRVYSLYAFSYDISFEVTAEQPQAEIEYSRVGNRFAFVANSRRAERIEWDFDDGTSSTDRYPVKEFPIGVFEVSLSATNNLCDVVVTTTEQVVVSGVETYGPDTVEMAEPLGFFILRMFGGGFTAGTEVTLSKDGVDWRPDRVGVPSPAELNARFLLTGASPGTYDLSVRFSGGETYEFPGGLTILQVPSDQRRPELDVNFSGPARVRTNRWTDYFLEITNNRGAMASGVLVGVVTPRNLETNFTEIVRRRTGSLEIKGDTWNMLSVDRQEFEDIYFDGDFDPDQETVEFAFSESLPYLEDYMNVDIDTLYGEPVNGTLHLLYIPIVRGNSTRQISFKLRSLESQNLELIGYAWPYTVRDNPPGPEFWDGVHEAGMQGAALAELAPHPALKAIGKWAGAIDISSQVLLAEGFDLYYGTNVADSEFYAKQGISAGFEAFNMKGPGVGGSKNARDRAVEFSREAGEYSKKSQIVKRQLDAGKFRPKTRQKLEKRYQEYLNEVSKLRKQGASEAEIYIRTKELNNYFKGRGLDLTSRGLQSLVEFPDDLTDTRPDRIRRRRVRSVRSFDPNAIYGEQGAGEQQFIHRGEALGYTITFENADTAEASAQIVRLESRLDPAVFDLRKTTLGNVYFGGNTYFLESSRTEYWTDVDLRPSQNLIVRINAKIDTLTGDLFWQFTSLDPQTMELTTDVDAGFLPPNGSMQEGEGGVSFIAHLLPQLVTGDSIGAQAHIFFDENDPIATNVWSNVIDNSPPVSALSSAYTELNDSTVRINYTGSDGESGLDRVYLKYRLAGQAWTDANVPLDDSGNMDVTVIEGATYEFYVLAKDSVGNWEEKAATAELSLKVGTTSVSGHGTLTGIALYPNPVQSGMLFLRSASSLLRSRVRVYDMLGHLVFADRLDLAADADNPILMDHAGSGAYVAEIITPDGRQWSQRFVVVR